MARPKFSDILDAQQGNTFYDSLQPGDVVDPQQRKRSNSYDERLATMGALVRAEGGEINVIDAYERTKAEMRFDPSLATTKKVLNEKVRGDIARDLDDVIKTYAENNDIGRAAMGAVSAQEINDQLEERSLEATIEDDYFESKRKTFDERLEDEQRFQLNAYGYIDEIMQRSEGALDTIVNYSGLLLSDMTLDWSRVTDTDFMNTPEAVGEFVQHWRTLPPATRDRMFPELAEAIYQASDENEVKTAIALMELLDNRPVDEIVGDLQLDQAFIGLDLATLGAAVTMKLAQLAKSTRNVVKSAKVVGNVEEAAKVNTSALVDPTDTIAKATGTERIVAATNGTPFPNEHILPEATDGISAEVEKLVSSIKQGQDRVRKNLEEVANGEGFLKETAFTEGERLRIREKAIDEITKINDEAAEMGEDLIENARILNHNEDGYTIVYSRGGIEELEVRDYTLSDLGTFDELPTGAIEKLIASPSYYLSGVMDRLVEGATNIELAQAKITDIFNRTAKEATKEMGSPLLHKKAYQELDEVMLAGDDWVNADGSFGKVFSLDELMYKGVETKTQGTVRLNPKQIKAYYALRELFDQAWVMKNKEVRKTLALHGFRDIEFEGLNTLGKPFKRVQDAARSMNKSNVSVIYDPTAKKGLGGVVNLSDVKLKEMYDKGYRVVRFQKHQRIKNNHVTYGLVKEHRITELPPYVLHHKQGYVPKTYEKGFYFVKEEIRGVVNSRQDKLVALKTHRIFDNKTEAEKFLRTLQDENKETVYRVLHDRELNEAQLADEAVGMSGGLYTSPRASTPPVFGLDGVTPARTSAFESLQRNINHLGNYLSRNEWRIGMQRKWINTARDKRMLDSNDFDGHLLGEAHTPDWNSLHAARNYIKDQIRVPTTEERWFEAKTRALAEWAEAPITFKGATLMPAKLPKHARTSLQQLAHKDPFSTARSITFHSLLGWFNPAQLFVQAQGSTIAMSLYPEHAPGAIRQYMGLRPLVHLSRAGADPKQIRQLSDKLAKGIGVPADDLWETYTLWRKTGLQESIRTTADLSAAAQNFGFGSSAFRDLAQKGLVFYREGEYFTRGIAFEVARREWKKANPKKVIGDTELKEILDHSMKLQLNLTRANRAAWQKGALSIPTQFLQIQTKFIEKLWPTMLGGKGGLTGTQKMKLLSMQFAIYGGAGIPFGSWITNEAMNFTGQSPEEMSPELKRYLKGGIWDTIFYATMGADVEMGKRGAVVSGIEDFFKSAIYDRAPLADSLFGAFGEIPTRTFKALGLVAPLVANPHKVDWTLEEAGMVANEFAKIVSTWRSIDQAIFMSKNQILYDKHGQIVIDRSLQGGFNRAEIVARGAGFALADVQATYDLEAINREWDNHIAKRVDSLIQLQYWYANRATHAGAGRNYEVMQQWLLADLNDYEIQRVLDLTRKRLARAGSKEERAINKFYKDTSDDLYEASPFHGGAFTNTIVPNEQDEE